MRRVSIPALLWASAAWSQAPDGYYQEANASSPEDLRQTVHAIIDDHQRVPYTSFQLDTWDVLEIGDEDQDDPASVTTIYRNSSELKQGGGNDFYNREHTWPRSYGFPDDDGRNYPFSDMHALFLADPDYNSARENRPYESCDTGCQELPTDANDGRGGESGEGSGGYPGTSNWTRGDFTDGSFEVWAQRRGDVARALMYMDLRYEGGSHGITEFPEPDLILTDDRDLIDDSRTGRNESVAYMGFLSTLLEWHAADPVDDIERQHHEAVFAAQGNRNPFIDHPEWADCLFQNRCQKQVQAELSGLWYNPSLDGEGFNVIVSEGGTTVFFYGYSAAGERVWLVSSLFEGQWEFDVPVSFTLFEGRAGTFDQPAAPPDGLGEWGTLILTFSDCGNGRFQLDGNDGAKDSQAIKLSGIEGLSC